MTIRTPAPTHMMRAACGGCLHEFDLCALPASMPVAARGMKRPCPICGCRRTYMRTSRPLDGCELDAAQRAALGALGSGSKPAAAATEAAP